jgi:hypothetical protein
MIESSGIAVGQILAILIRLRISLDVGGNERPEDVGIDETLLPLRLHSDRLVEITENYVIPWS